MVSKTILFVILFSFFLKNLPGDFAEFLWKSGFTSLQLCGPSGNWTNCSLLIRKVPRRSMKIGQGWKKFCRDNGFRGGDQVVFEFINEFSNLVNVKK